MVSWQIPITQQTSADPGSIPGWRKFPFVFAAYSLFIFFFHLLPQANVHFFELLSHQGVQDIEVIELSRAR